MSRVFTCMVLSFFCGSLIERYTVSGDMGTLIVGLICGLSAIMCFGLFIEEEKLGVW